MNVLLVLQAAGSIRRHPLCWTGHPLCWTGGVLASPGQVAQEVLSALVAEPCPALACAGQVSLEVFYFRRDPQKVEEGCSPVSKLEPDRAGGPVLCK